MKLCFASCVFMTLFILNDFTSSLIITRKKCPQPDFLNGRVRVMSQGRTARFKCNQTFQLLGEKYAVCLRGTWNMIPICVKPGCFPLPTLKNGQILESYKGAVVRLLCNPGYALFGSSFMYCNGSVWNGTIFECRAAEKMVQTWCDFESQDLCGWTQDPHHNFDWSRQNFQTPSGNVGTGPSFDHTLGPGRDGYYMFIESSSPRMENDTARLYSPVYVSQLTESQPSCFIFWYHMYGSTTGSLHVYVKPENAEFGGTLLPRFTKSGDQGNQWYQAIVLLPSINESFQVIIEAVRGTGYVSDIAIDDVKIANGSECLSLETQAPSPTETVDQNGGGNEIYDNTQSCRLRCIQTPVKAPLTETSGLEECECHSGCLQTATCCPDYASYCVLVTSLDAGKLNKSTSRPYPPPPPLPPLPPFPSSDLPTVPASTQSFLTFAVTSELPKPLENTEVQDITHKPIQPTLAQTGLEEYTSSTVKLNKRIPIPTDPTPLILQPPTAINISKKPSIIPKVDKSSAWFSTTNLVNTTITPHFTMFSFAVSQRPNPVVTELNKSVVSKSVNTLTNETLSIPSITLKLPTVSIPKQSSSISTTFLVPQQTSTPFKTTSVTQTYPKVTQSTRKPENMPIMPVTNSKRTTDTITPTVPQLIIRDATIPRETPEVTEQTKHSVSPTSVPWMNVTRGQEWISARRGPYRKQKEGLSNLAIVGILVTILLVTVVAVSIYCVVRNRRRVHKQQCMADDSDVRFLTSDEVLDFSLARPIEGNTDYL